jgi:hypothetical protein
MTSENNFIYMTLPTGVKSVKGYSKVNNKSAKNKGVVLYRKKLELNMFSGLNLPKLLKNISTRKAKNGGAKRTSKRRTSRK